MRDLTEEERALLDQITDAPQAFVKQAELGAHSEETLNGLMADGLIEKWSNSQDQLVTLTPFGAEVLDVVLIERAETIPPECPPMMWDSAHGRYNLKNNEDIEDYPCSCQTQRWNRRNPKTGFGLNEPTYVRMPRHPKRVSSDILMFLPAPELVSEFLTQADGKPVLLFAGGLSQGAGYPISIDLRLIHKSGQNGHAQNGHGPNLGHKSSKTEKNGAKNGRQANQKKTQRVRNNSFKSNSKRYCPDNGTKSG